jgi:hypothetical protein
MLLTSREEEAAMLTRYCVAGAAALSGVSLGFFVLPDRLQADSAASRCPASTQVRLVRSLVAAFNTGNAAAVDRLVAPEPAFRWFSAIGPDHRLGKRAEDRSTLRAYIRVRHRHRDHLTLMGFGSIDEQGHVDLSLVLKRRADDYRPPNPIRAKQDSVCPSGHAWLVVWSM